MSPGKRFLQNRQGLRPRQVSRVSLARMEILGVAPVASSSSSSSSSGGSSSNNNGSSSLAVSHLGSGALAAAALPHIARPPGEPSLLPSSQPLGPAVPKEDLMALKETLLGNAMASLATRHDRTSSLPLALLPRSALASIRSRAAAFHGRCSAGRGGW